MAGFSLHIEESSQARPVFWAGFLLRKGLAVATTKRRRRRSANAPEAAPAKPTVKIARGTTDKKRSARLVEELQQIMPLDVMLGAMRVLWSRAEALKGKAESEEERLALIRQASAEAHKAAVYIHPRLTSIDGSDTGDAGQPQGASGGGQPPKVRDLVLGSRDLARRLLFAVAFAEHAATETSDIAQFREKP